MFPTILVTFTPINIFLKVNLIYDKTPYVQLIILHKPWKFYIMRDGLDGDILQVCNSTVSKN